MASDPPTHPDVHVRSRQEAEAILMGEDAVPLVGVISIGSPSEPTCRGLSQVELVLRLIFDDVGHEPLPEPTLLDDPLGWVRVRMGGQVPDMAVIRPGMAHVQQIVAFADELAGTEGDLLIHCRAGISRSSATAFICLARWLGPGHEEEAMRRVLANRPQAVPNPSLIRLADAYLRREGTMLQAVGRAMSRRGFETF